MTPNKALTTYLSRFSKKERKAKTLEICRLCQISLFTFYEWRSGRTIIKPIYRDKINEIVGEDIFVNVTN